MFTLQEGKRSVNGQQGICGGAGASDYFLEPEVERMCGVCAMFW